MKKALSVLLAVVMMWSFSMIAFAAKPVVELGEEYTVETGEESIRYSFTVPEDGMYKLSARIEVDGKNLASAEIDVLLDDNYYASVDLFYADNSKLNPDPDSDFNLDDFNITEDDDYFVARGGAELTVRISNDAIPFGEENYRIPDSTVLFRITKADKLREIKMGESYTVNGDKEYFILKPTEDAVYNIWSYGCSYISVMNLKGESDGDFSSDDLPADYTFEAKAGEIYGICAEGDRGIEPIFYVVDATTISPDVIELDDITVVRGEDEYTFVEIYPVGARYNCGSLEVKVGNEKIATAEYDAENEVIVVHGKRLGRTTLTVTEPNFGTTAEVEIEVISKTANFFREIFSFIISFFEFIFGR